MRISDWSSDVCSSDLIGACRSPGPCRRNPPGPTETMRGCGGGGVAVSLVTGAACTGCVARGAAADAATVVGFGIAAGTADGLSACAPGFLATGPFEAAFLRPYTPLPGEGRGFSPKPRA